MVRLVFPPWVKRATAIGIVALLAFLAGAAWFMSNSVRAGYLVPDTATADHDLEIVAVGSGRIVLPRTDATVRDGVWGLEGEGAYGQVSTVIKIDEAAVERAFRTTSGDFAAGDAVRLDAASFAGDPSSAHGLAFEDVRVPGNLGAYPAWLIEGRRDTWAVFVHDEGAEGRRQSLRILPPLVEQGYTVLVISYRNDVGAPATRSGLRSWGLEEWRDLDAALTFATRRGAENFVLIGQGMGGEIVSMFLHESDRPADVAAVVLDSPVLDLEAVVDAGTRRRGVPSFFRALVRQVTRVRFGLEWTDLDQVRRAGEFDVPVLLLHGGADEIVPVVISEAFAAARPDLVAYERFEQAEHGQLWNVDPARYEAAVLAFLDEVVGPE